MGLTSFRLNILSAKAPGILLGAFAFFMLLWSQHISTVSMKAAPTPIAPPLQIEKFSFGFQESMADLFWIRALQDFDYCDQEVADKICRDHSWLYRMLNAVTDLSPSFRIAYAAGALALTVIISDIDGATKIFDKGVKAFPKDWPILYRAAYHYMYEVKDNKRAAELLIQAGKNGAPTWVFTLAGRLYSDAGSLELAEMVLQDMINTRQDPNLIKRLQDKITSMKSVKHSQ